MINHKHTNLVCMAVVLAAVLLTGFILWAKGQSSEDRADTEEMVYESRLFDNSKVHSIDLVINQDDWDNMQENASDKEYKLCNVVIDGKTFSNVGIRTKGNSSLSQVTGMDSERYSFKLEFDHYNDGNNCWGLDKLSLNNIVQDSTYMKDYLSYDMMNYMGVAAPLTSYVSVSVNGKSFGLYLAVEGIEESFVERYFGTDSDGLLYKPESAQMGGGENKKGGMPDMGSMDRKAIQDAMKYGKLPDEGQMPDGRNEPGGGQNQGGGPNQYGGQMPGMAGGAGGMFGDGKSDVALIYTDDKHSSYENIFDGAIFDITNTDKDRLISSIKQVNEGKNLDHVVNMEEVLKYFVVHTFVDNFDSYTGSMMHNYYLYEEDGKLSMVAWDYNLSFGGFSAGFSQKSETGSGTDEVTSLINYPIDTPVSGTTMEDRPLLNALLTREEYLNQYHDYYDEFISGYFESGHFTELVEKTESLIAPYVKEDKTAFYTYDEFVKGVETLKEFCDLRSKSVRGQLTGEIPSTTEGQKDSDTFVDGGDINISDMGSAGMGGGQKDGFGNRQPDGSQTSFKNSQPANDTKQDFNKSQMAGFPGMAMERPDKDGFTGSIPVTSKIMLGVSLSVLAAAFIFLKVFKRKKRMI